MATKTIWRLPVVMSHTGLGRSSIYQKIGKGEFPRQINLGARSVGWLESEVLEWITERVEQSRSASEATR